MLANFSFVFFYVKKKKREKAVPKKASKFF